MQWIMLSGMCFKYPNWVVAFYIGHVVTMSITLFVGALLCRWEIAFVAWVTMFDRSRLYLTWFLGKITMFQNNSQSNLVASSIHLFRAYGLRMQNYQWIGLGQVLLQLTYAGICWTTGTFTYNFLEHHNPSIAASFHFAIRPYVICSVTPVPLNKSIISTKLMHYCARQAAFD